MKSFPHTCSVATYSQTSSKRTPNMEVLVVAYGRAKNHKRSLPIGCLDTSTLCKILYCLQFLSHYTMYVQFHIVTKILHEPLVAEYIYQRSNQKWSAYKRLKTIKSY